MMMEKGGKYNSDTISYWKTLWMEHKYGCYTKRPQHSREQVSRWKVVRTVFGAPNIIFWPFSFSKTPRKLVLHLGSLLSMLHGTVDLLNVKIMMDTVVDWTCLVHRLILWRFTNWRPRFILFSVWKPTECVFSSSYLNHSLERGYTRWKYAWC